MPDGVGGTYVEVPAEALPPIPPDSLDGTFRWLVDPTPGLDRMQCGQDDEEPTADQIAAVLAARIAEATRAGWRPSLSWCPSPTGPLPVGGGRSVSPAFYAGNIPATRPR